ncbi:hypothetical protein N9P77_01745 [Amylibacter sp.]|nr:hypothetical protein [Amylibacter sp.]
MKLYRNKFGVLSIRLMGLEISASKFRSSIAADSAYLKKYFNDTFLEMIEANAKCNLDRDFSVLSFADASVVTNMLKCYGIVKCSSLQSILDVSKKLRSDLDSFAKKSNYYRDVSFADEKLEFDIDDSNQEKSYDYYTSRNKTVVNLRGRTSRVDEGMIDIFNPEFYFDIFRVLKAEVQKLKVEDILTEINNEQYELKNCNIYINKSVTHTRGMHVDDYTNSSYKLFVYLTDVTDLKFGPYSYLTKSHRRPEGLERISYSLAAQLHADENDIHFALGSEHAVPLFGDTGSIIISNQSGAHQGYPQKIDAQRSLAVFHYNKV